MEINEMSSIPDLKKYAAENGIEVPNNIRTKGAILKHIAESSTDMERKSNEGDTSNSNAKATEEEDNIVTAEASDKLPEEVSIDYGTGPDQTATSRLIIRSDSQGIHTYNRDTGVSTLTRYDEVL